MEQHDLFPGIGIGGYRSFAREPAFIAPLRRVNLLIGPNNVGKSTALRAFQHLAPLSQTLQNGSQLSSAFDAGSDRRDVEGEDPGPFTLVWPVKPTDESLLDLSLLTRDEWPWTGTSHWLQFENGGTG